jgi:hypothetical protein
MTPSLAGNCSFSIMNFNSNYQEPITKLKGINIFHRQALRTAAKGRGNNTKKDV